jgi:hypothetical protein
MTDEDAPREIKTKENPRMKNIEFVRVSIWILLLSDASCRSSNETPVIYDR